MINLILFGPPGAGKGTQAKKLADRHNLMHISTGDILRNEIAQSTPLGLKVKDIMDRGELVSDAILIEILRSVIEKHKDVNGFIFDGFPRTVPQAEALEDMMRQEGQKIAAVISLEVNEEELIKRLLNRALELGRSDDTEEVIKNRLSVYTNQTSVLKQFYTEKGLVHIVNGIGSIDDIFSVLVGITSKLN